MSDIDQAFYRLTVAQRDAAWTEAARYRAALQRIVDYAPGPRPDDMDFRIVQRMAEEALKTVLAPPSE